MTQLLRQKEFSSLEILKKEELDNDALQEILEKEELVNDALQVELNRIVIKRRAMKQIQRVDALLHRAKRTSENILIGNKILPAIFEE